MKDNIASSINALLRSENEREMNIEARYNELMQDPQELLDRMYGTNREQSFLQALQALLETCGQNHPDPKAVSKAAYGVFFCFDELADQESREDINNG